MEKEELIVLFCYIVLTLIMTYPLIFKMNFYTTGDTQAFIWSFWWVKHALFDFKTDLFYTNHIFYPIGMDLSLYTLTYFNTFFSLPLQLFFDEIVTYNIMFLFSFIVSGFGMFLLVRYLTNDIRASFVTGIIFAFCPFRFAHAMGHMTVLSTEWIPFYVLYLIKTLKETNKKNAILAGIFLALNALSEWHYLLFLTLFSIFFLFYYYMKDRKTLLNKKFLINGIVLLSVFLLITFPFLFKLLGASSNPGAKRQLDPSIMTSADLMSFFVPSEFHPIFGKYVSGIYSLFTGITQENTHFIGYTVIFLSVFAIFKLWEKTKIWFFLGIIFFVLSLGPVLHIFGKFLYSSPIQFGNILRNSGFYLTNIGYDLLNRFIGIPLPYLFLHYTVPFFKLFRTPGRFSVLVIFSFSVIAGYSLSLLLKKSTYKNLVFIIFISLILLESLAVPIELNEFYIPRFYYQLAYDKGDYAIVEVPMDYGFDMLLQTFHNKRLVSGAYSRKHPNTTNFIDTTPLLLKLKDISSARKSSQNNLIRKVMNANPEASVILEKYIDMEVDIYSQELVNLNISPSQLDVKRLQENNVKYIIIHKLYLSQKEFDEANHIVRKFVEKYYEDEDVIVYKIY